MFYKVLYVRTGRKVDTDWVSGIEASNVIEAAKEFEKIAASWGTYETVNSIIRIEQE